MPIKKILRVYIVVTVDEMRKMIHGGKTASLPHLSEVEKAEGTVVLQRSVHVPHLAINLCQH